MDGPRSGHARLVSQFKDHFSGVASHYATYRPSYPPALFAYLASLCSERTEAWDCACGSGQATIALTEWFDAVQATDASAQQIAGAPAHDKVRYSVAPAEQSGLDISSVDLIIVAQAVHWFDHDRFYAEANRVLRAGGVLAVFGYGVHHVEGDEIDRVMQHFYFETMGPYWPPERRYIEVNYTTLPFPYAEVVTPTFELVEHWPLEHLLGYLRSWSATSRYVKENGHDPVEPLGVELAALWGDPRTPRRVSWPLPLRVGRKSLP